MLRVHRSRGAASGVLLMLLGACGGLIPFVGPYAHFAYTPDSAWTWTGARAWLEVLPGAITLIAGLVMALTRLRLIALLAALLAALSGAWFAVGGVLAPLWPATSSLGTPTGGPVVRALEQIGFFSGAGVVIVATASIAMGRLATISAKDMRTAAASAPVSTSPGLASATGGSRPSGPPASGVSPWGGTALPMASEPMTPATAGSGMTSTGTPATGSISFSADEMSSADTITSKSRQGHAGKGNWRLAGRATLPRAEPDDPES